MLGTVTDASGSVIPNAKIEITNEGENVSRLVMTDSQGHFEALNLKAGITRWPPQPRDSGP
jgi:hypothetical protein